ncbi:MAG: polysaccharide biosynthesis protein [Phycisphaerae bacterium]|nr:polysaccharide biosynthesis protein [Phycisphaerae bacterium]
MDDANDQQNNNGPWMWARTHRALLSVGAHLILFVLAWFLAFGVAYNFKQFGDWFKPFFLPLLVPVVAIKLAIFTWMGLHRGWWRYVSLRDVFQVTRAAWLGFFCAFVLYYLLANARLFGLTINFFGGGGADRFPDSVFLIDFAGTIALICGARFAVRLYYEEIGPAVDMVAPRLLIIGAGNAAENVVREILRLPTLNYRVVGFLDDDRSKWRGQIHGIEVLGGIDQVKAVCDEQDVDEILIALPSATRDQMRRVVELCQGTALRFKTLPAISDLIAGKPQYGQIREVDINDLLGRAPVTLDVDEIAQFIKNRVVMVTGAGGSIGSEMCRQIAAFGPRRLILAEQAEQNLFEIDKELRRDRADLNIVPYIVDIGDARRVRRILELEQPTAVVHAAAHKHVPMMEYNPGEAIKNNIHGTRTLADAAVAAHVEKFVMISTDKAVNPTSIMGCSKRVAEMYVQGLARQAATQFVTVRFGNVLGSSGSVIPIFKEQIARGGPVTVTHPDMVRYFMTIPEAAQLVLQAASMGKGGEIFVLDMGDPVKIVDLARDLITLSGYRPNEDIPIEFCGIRPGEKLYEELAIDGEDVSRTAHPKIGIWQNITVDLNELVPVIDSLLERCDTFSRDDVRRELKAVVPEFQLEAPAPPASDVLSEAVETTAKVRIAPA